MILKRTADDFRVEEVSRLAPAAGRHALYRLTKRGIGTPEALAAIARRWKLQRRQLACAGLKDRHAVTTQVITIDNGPRRDLAQTNIELTYLGQVDRPVQSTDITANRFTVVVRDLAAAQVERLEGILAAAQRDGLPNYFDEQRFGSVGASGEFMARAWCLGDHQRALRLVLAEPDAHDRPPQRAAKEFVAKHWGQWDECRRVLARSPYLPALTHLALKPGDWRGAVHLLPAEQRRLWLAAFQSDLWNRLLAALLQQQCRPEQLLPATIGVSPAPFWRVLEPAQREFLAACALPLPSIRTHLEPGPIADLVQCVLHEAGLQLRDLKADNLRDSFFSKGDRAALYRPRDVRHAVAADELYPGQQKATLGFVLPRGCYATILVRRLTLED